MAAVTTVIRQTLPVTVLLVGTPVALVRLAGPPLPRTLPSAQDLTAFIHDPLTPGVLTGALVGTAWLLWAALAATALAGVRARLAGAVRLPAVRLPPPVRALHAALLGTAAVTTTTSGLTAAPPPPATASAAPTVDHLPPAELAATHAAAAPHCPPGGEDPAKRPSVTVRRGDTLSGIAARHLDDHRRWPAIYDLNHGRRFPTVGGRFTDPDLIFPGWTLWLPDSRPARDCAGPPADSPTGPDRAGGDGSTPAPSPADTPTPTSPGGNTEPTADSSPPPSSETPPAASTPVDVAPPAAPTPAAPTTGTPSAPPAADISPRPHTDPTPNPDHHDAAPAFITVVGGIITAGLAAGLLTAAATVWRRRRHVYRPTPVDAADPADGDLTPPLSDATRLRQVLRRHHPDLLDTTTTGATVHDHNTTAAPAPPVGPTGTDLAGLAGLPAPGGLGLDGPGALDAARGLLVSCLSAGTPDDPDAQGHVVTDTPTLARLLGTAADDLPATRRLTVTTTAVEALTHVEAEIIRRSRILTDHDVTTIADLRTAHPLAEPLPHLLLIAEAPAPGHRQRTATTIGLGERVDISAALIGPWPDGTTLTITADGHTTGTSHTGQITVLDTHAATAALRMLTEAHADTPPHSITEPPPPTPPATSPAATPTTAAEAPAPAGHDQRVRVRVMGQPAVLGPDGQPMTGLRAKSLELLVYLAVHRDGAALSAIMEAIWPDATMRRAAERLSTCVANLRNVLRAAHPTPTTSEEDTGGRRGGRAGRGPDPIPNTGSRYHLDPTIVHVDLWTVLDAYAQAATVTTDQDRLLHLDAAIAATAGPLADGEDYDWIDTDREHLRRRLIKIYAHAAGLHADPHHVRDLYDRACAIDPLSDDLARRAMRASAALGDAPAIRARLTALRRALHDNGLDLDDDTAHLARDLLHTLTNQPHHRPATAPAPGDPEPAPGPVPPPAGGDTAPGARP
jgi:DNA-binding SARP family transcriptional activator